MPARPSPASSIGAALPGHAASSCEIVLGIHRCPLPPTPPSKPLRSVQLSVCIACVAAALLGWEVLLTRLASLRYHFHFGNLAVSNGLLGIGAAASWLGMNRHRWRAQPDQWVATSLLMFAGSLALSIIALYRMPVHLGPMNAEGSLLFALFALASLAPFVTGGLSLGLLLSGWPDRTDRLYGIDLLAAGTACLCVPLLLPALGMAGALACIVLLVIAALLSIRPRWTPAGFALALLTAAWASTAGPAPSKITRSIIHSTWTPLSRVDVVDIPPETRTIRARGRAARPSDVPPQVEVMQDGSASTLLTDFSGHPESRALLTPALYSAATQIRTGANVFVVGFGGGDDVWAALEGDPTRIDAVDLHHPVLAAHTSVRPEWSRVLLEDPRIHLTVMEGRTALNRLDQTYDIVQLTGIDTWAALSSGAFMLAENYLYTTESFATMIDRLSPNGVLQITRMAAEMETLRVLVQLRHALTERSRADFAACIIVIGSADHQVATLLNREGFTSDDTATVIAWAEASNLVVHHAPGMEGTGLIHDYVVHTDPDAFVQAFPRLIEPTTDESPYFFQFTRWTEPTSAAESIREPTYISQGNPIWIAGLALYSLVTAMALLFGPIWLNRRRTDTAGVTRYFWGIGMGYIMVELALMNSVTLLLGHPMRAFSVTLSTMLIASGFASLQAHRLNQIRWVPPALAGLVSGTLFLLPRLTEAAFAWNDGARVLLVIALTVPFGLLLGLPFAHRITKLAREQIPWAWATNAFASVVGAVLVVAISMTISFAAVLWVAVAIYGLALYAPARTSNR